MQEDVYQGDGLNLYAYCGNNPVRYYDPSGYSKTPEVYNTGCPGATTNGDVGKKKEKLKMMIQMKCLEEKENLKFPNQCLNDSYKK